MEELSQTKGLPRALFQPVVGVVCMQRQENCVFKN